MKSGILRDSVMPASAVFRRDLHRWRVVSRHNNFSGHPSARIDSPLALEMSGVYPQFACMLQYRPGPDERANKWLVVLKNHLLNFKPILFFLRSIQMKLRPLHDRVIVKRMEEERMSAGGIVIPDSATEKPIRGEVLSVGNGKILDNGEQRSLDIKAGDKILFGKYSGTEVKVDGEELLVMREDDIMAVIEN
jgi:chaperonin GroES